ncbi:glycerol-3-phosphate 1-O-acyltransferase PlsY [Allohahella marinimesophila]|uniref:Glycerol-3-phosphate acyltransferase n=1 Tax=Allohahella marinimesophila TaxID=1054972 RepID=A0ABP7P5S6_9GAMM
MVSTGFMICLPLAYLLGSSMGAYLVCAMFGLPSPSESGSRNPGATNVYRLGGLLPAALTLLWDAGKGALAVGIGRLAGLEAEYLGLVAIAAVLGHILPIYHKFQGGKGVATMLGTGLALAFSTSLILAIVWWTLLLWKRISSLASLAAAGLAPWVAYFFNPEFTLFFVVLSLVLVIRHRDNIIALAKGKEQSL